VDLGSLEPDDINNRRQVVGRFTSTNGGRYAAIYQRGVIKEFKSLADKFYSAAVGINDRGQVVGQFADSTNKFVPSAFLLHRGKLRILDTNSQARAELINNRGEITGWFHAGPGFIQGHRFTPFPPFTVVRGLNGRGSIAGFYFDPLGTDGDRALLYHHGSWQELGTLAGDSGSDAWAVNAHNQVVGNSIRPDAEFGHYIFTAFIWQKGVMTNLNDLVVNLGDWKIGFATSINNRGWITGSAVQSGKEFPVLLRPVRRTEESAR